MILREEDAKTVELARWGSRFCGNGGFRTRNQRKYVQGQPKRGSPSRRAVQQHQVPAQLLGQSTRERKAKAGASEGTRDRRIGLCEWLKQIRMSIRRDADPGIGHIDHPLDSTGAMNDTERNENPAGVGELDCVRNQIHENLTQPIFVGLERAERIVRNLDSNIDPFRPALDFKTGHDLAHEVEHAHQLRGKRYLVRVEPGQVYEIANDREERPVRWPAADAGGRYDPHARGQPSRPGPRIPA